jgi:hypothetical protein
VVHTLFRQVGFMRGTIDSGTDQWTGNYYLSGLEARRGTFSLGISSGVMSGTFTESNGAVETISETQSSTTEPTDLECFKVDTELLDGSGEFTFGGDWLDNVERFVHVDETDRLTGSYDYGENQAIPGWYYGRVSEGGQVAQLNWYDPGDLEGIYIFGAKNSTAQYIIWWGFDWISDFDYTSKNVNFWGDDGFGTRIDLKINNIVDYSEANRNRCYMLNSESSEASCMEQDSAYSEFNTLQDDNDELMTLVTVVLAFTVVTTVAAVIACAKSLTGGGSAPMAGSEKSEAKL